MGLSKEVRELLQQGREAEAAELAIANPRALRPLVGRLWDPLPEIRLRAARVVGLAAAANPDLGLEVIRRLMWALNDESATNGVHALPALGEIGRRAPDLLAPFVSPLVSMSWDGCVRLELLQALAAVAESAPDLIGGHLSRLEDSLDDTRAEERQAFDRLVAATAKGGGR
jgi:hypothetical protein